MHELLDGNIYRLAFDDPFSNRTNARLSPRGLKPGPNDILPCGTTSAIRRHLAKGEQCRRCRVSVLPAPPMLYSQQGAA